MEYKDYYSILDVDRKAGPEEFEELFGAGGGGYSDFFKNLFGRAAQQQAGGGAGDQQFYYEPQPRRGRDFEHRTAARLADATPAGRNGAAYAL